MDKKVYFFGNDLYMRVERNILARKYNYIIVFFISVSSMYLVYKITLFFAAYIEQSQWRTAFRNSDCSFHRHPLALYNVLTRARKMLMRFHD